MIDEFDIMEAGDLPDDAQRKLLEEFVQTAMNTRRRPRKAALAVASLTCIRALHSARPKKRGRKKTTFAPGSPEFKVAVGYVAGTLTHSQATEKLAGLCHRTQRQAERYLADMEPRARDYVAFLDVIGDD